MPTGLMVQISVLLSASAERVGVFRMQDFFNKREYSWADWLDLLIPKYA